jgi:molybdate transport system substrate-binding protein
MKKAAWTIVAGFLAMLAASAPAHSQANLKVFADTPLRAALIQIGEALRRGGGPQVDFVFGPSPVILKKLADGDAADVLIAQPHHIADLIESGKIVAGDYPVLGRVGLGLAVRADAPPQRIDTVEALREVLLKADTLVTNTIVPGDLFVGVLERLNIANLVKPKLIRLPPGPALYEKVIRSNGNDITAGIFTILKETPGLRVLGPLPAEVQPYQHYAAAPMTAALSLTVAKEFIALLVTPAAKAAFAASGVE